MRWMDLNTQRGQKAEARPSVNRRKTGYIVRPKCFISHSRGLMHTILLFSSTLRSISIMSQLVLLSSFSPLPRKVWTINEEGTHVPHAGTCTGPFLSLQPLQYACAPSWLSAALHRKPEQIIFCKAATEGPVKSSLCVNIS